MDKDHRRGLNSIVDDRETLARIRAELASMTMLNALGNLLTATPDLPSILYEIPDATIKLRGADFGDVQLYDEAIGTLKIIRTSCGRSPKLKSSNCDDSTRSVRSHPA